MAALIKHFQAESKRRLDKFHVRCQEKARSKKIFDRSFIIESDHIIKRGQDQNCSLRSAIQHEHMASLIVHGRVNSATCRDEHPLELAIDGLFRDFKYVEFGTSGAISEITIPMLRVRVVIRDRVTKLMIVTVHPDQDKKLDETLPEVPHEIW